MHLHLLPFNSCDDLAEMLEILPQLIVRQTEKVFLAVNSVFGMGRSIIRTFMSDWRTWVC